MNEYTDGSLILITTNFAKKKRFQKSTVSIIINGLNKRTKE